MTNQSRSRRQRKRRVRDNVELVEDAVVEVIASPFRLTGKLFDKMTGWN